ncbi:MAG: DUF2459 domain-containing protein [Sphingomonadales bacterium]
MLRILRFLALVVLIPIGLYLAAAAILGHSPANTDWREPDAGITIFVQSNGVHTGIVLPAGPGKWRAYGWGDRDFYLDTPRWQDMRPGTVIAALIESGRTVMHVDDLDDFAPDEYWRPLRLRPHEYARLRENIAATFEPGGKPIPGYTPRDRFYPARGGYSALTTCNVWTGRALKAAGVQIGIWTPFASDVMRWVPKPR